MAGRSRKPRGPEAATPQVQDSESFAFTLDSALPLVIPPQAKAASVKSKAEKPHYHDHRARLRARFEEAGPGALADYELLELFLFRTIPRQDTKPLAKALLAKFGTLAGVLGAPAQRIAEVKGAGPSVAQDLKIVQALLERASKAELHQRPVISSWSQLVNYCRVAMQHEPREQFRVLFLDAKNQLITDEVMNEGTVDHAPVYPREIARRALEVSAASIILVHNHPTWPFRSRSITPHHLETQELLGLSQSRSLWHIGVGFKGIKALFDPSRRPHEPVERPQLEADGEPQCQALQMEKFAEP